MDRRETRAMLDLKAMRALRASLDKWAKPGLLDLQAVRVILARQDSPAQTAPKETRAIPASKD
jgi:hypothetical protein